MSISKQTHPGNRQSGFTLLELLLVIGVAALLLIGGIATYRLVSDGNRATESTRLLLTLRQEAANMAQQQGGNYTGITYNSTPGTASPLITAGVLRDGQRNAFNGVIDIAPATNVAADDNIAISFANVSQSACVKLTQAINNANEIVSVTVNGGTAINTFPMNIAAATGACTTATNTIVWQLP